jgi:hypothetical protein
MVRKTLSLSSLYLTLLLTGCSTTRVTLPPRSATEQMLVSEAAEAAAIAIHLKIPPKTKAFLDTTNFEGLDAKYAVSAIKQSLLEQGNAIIDTRTDADVIIEVRAGALSIDSISQTIGVPGIDLSPVSIPLHSDGVKIGTRAKTIGVAKFSLFAYDRKTGKLMCVVAQVVGMSHRTANAATIMTWTNVRGTQ